MQLFINGRWVEAREGGHIDVVSAHSEQVIATVAEGTEADMDVAVAAARAAFDQGPWPRLSPAERIAKVKELATALRAR
jgi:aldehyde dehydrogenase (NAD+)